MVKCPYCSQDTKMVMGRKIYPHRADLYGKFFYLCEPCDAYVGAHPGTNEPLGIPANAILRKLRNKCHSLFDPLWQTGEMHRKDAYVWLQDKMNLLPEDAHIGKFNEAQCYKLIALLHTRHTGGQNGRT